jgi:hypothetical protein
MAKTPKKKLIAEWKAVFDDLSAEGLNDVDAADNHTYWVNEESDFQSICVGWCMGRGMSLDEALNFYQQMIPLDLF